MHKSALSFLFQNSKADYSPESHQKDHEVYNSTSRSKRKRARAILDFERRDDDELGFRKNDIVTIISQKDEHCWVGELNGHQGWFPAKLVEVLDERSKEYSFAGDDSVTQAVTDIVRGILCPAVKKILEHGLRRYFGVIKKNILLFNNTKLSSYASLLKRSFRLCIFDRCCTNIRYSV